LDEAMALMRDHHAAVVKNKPTPEQLEAMALAEEKLYQGLNPEQREKTYAYAMALFSPPEDRAGVDDMALANEVGLTHKATVGGRVKYFEAMKQLGVTTYEREMKSECFADVPEAAAAPAAEAAAANVPKYAQCIGFIIGHRRCCAQNVGNGVCGGGPSDCHHLNCGGCIQSESCPPGGCTSLGC
jgi:hypothetical protein